ncbi:MULTISPECIES: hypothetical protein [Methylorubrum]|uniref:hypothetical protein n=1 Tax=Methylorubrum TaxID=2282523 RepID=UPI0020A03015|nr:MULTISPECIES: hypothetical protein [Methylorubrum]MCP1550723.1 hypothetical protein [Methylorubrum zatmanii]MCP1552664.1 hypothetical protein [Methylorubrum extorquens]MCP1581026.1 hypothetical protein [Methylorubrum extorquens]
MPLYGPSNATATVTANTNSVAITGMDLNAVVQQGMTISFGARDRAVGDAWIINTVVPNGTNGGTLTTAGSIPTAYNSVPFLIDTRGFNGTDSSFAAAVSLKLLATLTNLLGTATNLFAGSRQLVLDKVASTAIGRIAFAIAGRTWGDISQRSLSYTPTGGQVATIETLALRAFPDGATPSDALLIDLANGTGDLRQGSATMASAAMVDLGSAPAGKVTITGGAVITSFGPGKHLVRLLRFTEGATLTHSAPSLVLPGGRNIVTQGGDTALATSDAAGNWTVRHYQRASGYPVIAPQVVSGNSGTTPVPAGTTRYFTNALVGINAALAYVPAGRAGRFKNLRVITGGAPGANQTYKFTLEKLFSDTALTCTISGSGSNQASDLVNSVEFAAGERWSIKVEASAGAPDASNILFSMLFEATD